MTLRLKTIRLTGDIFLEIFRGRTTSFLASGIPQDAKIVDSHFDCQRDRLTLTVTSGEFEEVSQGDWPELAVTLMTIRQPIPNPWPSREAVTN